VSTLSVLIARSTIVITWLVMVVVLQLFTACGA